MNTQPNSELRKDILERVQIARSIIDSGETRTRAAEKAGLAYHTLMKYVGRKNKTYRKRKAQRARKAPGNPNLRPVSDNKVRISFEIDRDRLVALILKNGKVLDV